MVTNYEQLQILIKKYGKDFNLKDALQSERSGENK